MAGTVDTPGPGARRGRHGGYAYVADYGLGLQVIDVTDPQGAQIVANANTPGTAYGVTLAGGYAYVADYGLGLQVIDIADPLTPLIVGAADTPATPRTWPSRTRLPASPTAPPASR